MYIHVKDVFQHSPPIKSYTRSYYRKGSAASKAMGNLIFDKISKMNPGRHTVVCAHFFSILLIIFKYSRLELQMTITYLNMIGKAFDCIHSILHTIWLCSWTRIVSRSNDYIRQDDNWGLYTHGILTSPLPPPWSSFLELKAAITFFVPMDVAPLSLLLNPPSSEIMIGSASFPLAQSSAEMAGSSPAVSGKRSDWKSSD